MAQFLFANNAVTTLAGPITNTSTTLNVSAGTSALFPVPGAGQFFCLTLQDAATRLLTEIMHVTAVSGDTFTVARAQENTTALNWLANDLAGNLVTAGALVSFAQTNSIPTSIYEGTDTGSANALVVTTTTPASSAPVAGQISVVTKSSTSGPNTGAVSLRIGSSDTSHSVVYNDGSALTSGAWLASATAVLFFTGSVHQVLAFGAGPTAQAANFPSLSPPKNGRLISGAGTYTLMIGGTGLNDPPATVTDVFVTGVGAGGGGAAASTANTGTTWSGGGGASGGAVADWFRGLAPGDTITLVNGAGGAGSPSSNGNTGATGGSSTATAKGRTISATGGLGGKGGLATCAGGIPGLGSGSALGYNLNGAPGGDGNTTTNSVQGGGGGGSIFGGGGRTSTLGSNHGSSPNGLAPGSGGGGIWQNSGVSEIGGNGADGAWFVQW